MRPRKHQQRAYLVSGSACQAPISSDRRLRDFFRDGRGLEENGDGKNRDRVGRYPGANAGRVTVRGPRSSPVRR